MGETMNLDNGSDEEEGRGEAEEEDFRMST